MVGFSILPRNNTNDNFSINVFAVPKMETILHQWMVCRGLNTIHLLPSSIIFQLCSLITSPAPQGTTQVMVLSHPAHPTC